MKKETWRISFTEIGDRKIANSNNDGGLCIMANDERVCTIWPCGEIVDNTKQKDLYKTDCLVRNARTLVIVNAPELLRACETALNELDRLGKHDDYSQKKVMDILKKVIAKTALMLENWPYVPIEPA